MAISYRVGTISALISLCRPIESMRTATHAQLQIALFLIRVPKIRIYSV